MIKNKFCKSKRPNVPLQLAIWNSRGTIIEREIGRQRHRKEQGEALDLWVNITNGKVGKEGHSLGKPAALQSLEGSYANREVRWTERKERSWQRQDKGKDKAKSKLLTGIRRVKTIGRVS